MRKKHLWQRRKRLLSRWKCSTTAFSRKPRESAHRLIGQVFETYWLVEYDGSLYIIDQHAAHEKVLFEKNFASLKTREYTSQLVSPPIILTLSLQEADLLKRHMKVFTDIGFEIEPFGGNEYAVRAVPDNLFSLAKKDLLMELIDGLSDESMGKNVESILRPDRHHVLQGGRVKETTSCPSPKRISSSMNC